jgi:hypothetical protein
MSARVSSAELRQGHPRRLLPAGRWAVLVRRVVASQYEEDDQNDVAHDRDEADRSGTVI